MPWQDHDVGSLPERLSISERQLRRRVHEATGLAPKTLHRILRFQGLLALAQLALAQTGTRSPTGSRGSRRRPATPISRTWRGSAGAWRASPPSRLPARDRGAVRAWPRPRGVVHTADAHAGSGHGRFVLEPPPPAAVTSKPCSAPRAAARRACRRSTRGPTPARASCPGRATRRPLAGPTPARAGPSADTSPTLAPRWATHSRSHPAGIHRRHGRAGAALRRQLPPRVRARTSALGAHRARAPPGHQPATDHRRRRPRRLLRRRWPPSRLGRARARAARHQRVGDARRAAGTPRAAPLQPVIV